MLRRAWLVVPLAALAAAALLVAEWCRSYRSTGEFNLVVLSTPQAAAGTYGADACAGRAVSALSRRGSLDVVFISFQGQAGMVLRGYQSSPRLRLHWLVDAYEEPAPPPRPLFRLEPVAVTGPPATERGWAVRTPHWAPAAAAGAVALAGFAPTWRRRRRRRRGLCPTCGYDLRHSTERCPECGAPIQAPAKPTPSAAPATAA